MTEAIAPWLFERFESFRDDPAIVFASATASYGDLLARVDFWLAELEKHGVGAGSVVVVEGNFSPNAIALVLSLIRVAAIVVPLTPLSSVHRTSYEEISEAS